MIPVKAAFVDCVGKRWKCATSEKCEKLTKKDTKDDTKMLEISLVGIFVKQTR